jgi:hypothetical protein
VEKTRTEVDALAATVQSLAASSSASSSSSSQGYSPFHSFFYRMTRCKRWFKCLYVCPSSWWYNLEWRGGHLCYQVKDIKIKLRSCLWFGFILFPFLYFDLILLCETLSLFTVCMLLQKHFLSLYYHLCLITKAIVYCNIWDINMCFNPNIR